MTMRACGMLSIACSLAAQTTWIVDAGNPSALPTLAATVAVASDGDTVVIRHSGEWLTSSVVLNKSLRIVGDSPAAPGGAPELRFFFGTGLHVQIAAGKELLLANVTLWSMSSTGFPQPSVLAITSSAGRVTLQDVPAGVFAINVVQSSQVILSRVAMTMAAPLRVAHAAVVCDRCTLLGRAANYQTSAPSVVAMDLDQAEVHCVDTVITGGNAAWHLGWVSSQPGSRAIHAVASVLTMSGPSCAVASGALAGVPPIDATQSSFAFPPGLQPGITGTATVASVELPSVDATSVVSGSTAQFTVRSPIGSLAGLVFGVPGDRLGVPGVLGDLWIDPLSSSLPVAGIQTGGMSWTVPVPPSPTLFGAVFRWQPIVLSSGQFVLGAPASAALR
jgi:hypothetical protein